MMRRKYNQVKRAKYVRLRDFSILTCIIPDPLHIGTEMKVTLSSADLKSVRRRAYLRISRSVSFWARDRHFMSLRNARVLVELLIVWLKVGNEEENARDHEFTLFCTHPMRPREHVLSFARSECKHTQQGLLIHVPNVNRWKAILFLSDVDIWSPPLHAPWHHNANHQMGHDACYAFEGSVNGSCDVSKSAILGPLFDSHGENVSESDLFVFVFVVLRCLTLQS